MRVSDTGTAGVSERVALAESYVRLNGNIVTLCGVLHLLYEFFNGLRETALVGEYPGFSAVAFEEHHFAVAERRCFNFFDDSVFGGEYGPAFFHLRRVVDAGMVTRAAILSERGC